MKRNTTTKQLNDAITNNILAVTKVKCEYKEIEECTEIINNDAFIESLQYLNESGVLAANVDWKYEKSIHSNGEYIVESGRMNPYAGNIITVHIRACDGVSDDEVETLLKKEESEKVAKL